MAALLAVPGLGCAPVPVVEERGADEEAPPVERGVERAAASTALAPELIYDYLLADLAARRGRLDESLAAMVRVAERTRSHALAARALHFALRLKKGAVATRMARLMIETGEQPLESSFALARAHLLSGRRADAVAAIDALLGDDAHDNAEVFDHAARLFATQPNAARYVPDMARLAAARPDDADGFHALAHLAHQAGDFVAFERAIGRTLQLRPRWERAALLKLTHLIDRKRLEEIKEYALEFLSDNPGALTFRGHYANHLLEANDPRGAYEQFSAVVRRDPDNDEALLSAALASRELGELRRAERLLLRHLERNPDDDRTHMHLGELAAQRERHDLAIDWYSKVRDERLFSNAQIRIADSIHERDGGDAALAHLHRLIPGSAEEEVNLLIAQVRVLQELERLDDARELLDAALQEFPDNLELLYARALVAAEMHRIDLHEADIRRIIRLNPDNAHAYNALGYTLADQTDRHQEAFELISHAIRLQPDNPFILDSMGWVQFRLGRLDEAEVFLRRAHALRRDAVIAAHLGEVLWVSGRRNEANEIWEQGLEIDPENKTLKQTIERLRP